LRLDVIHDITSQKAKSIISSVKNITDIPIILTNRSSKEGGLFNKSEEERTKILSENSHLVEITDIELSTEESLRQQVIDSANKTIISYHNFDVTPDKDFLQEIINQAFKLGDIPKIAVKPNTNEDTYVILQLLMENKGIIAISMDKMGSYTRIIGPLLGSPVTYATITTQSAPGQFDIKTTSEIIKKLKN
jgi:3-dehydroquinate dehydratase-1